jgi:hypothetical protein
VSDLPLFRGALAALVADRQKHPARAKWEADPPGPECVVVVLSTTELEAFASRTREAV